MAKWQDGVITNAGISLLGEVIAGGEINITRAALGGGTVDEAALMAQTALSFPLSVSPVIAAKKLVEGKGIEIRIQIRNDGLAEDKVMKQVGLFAKLNSGDEVLFAIMQDDTGEEIPSEASYPDFMLEYTAALAVSNNGNITVSVSGSAVITQEALDDALKSKADKTYVDEALKGKSDTDHTHDDLYYTESETDALLNGKAASSHTHSNATTSAPGFMSADDKSKLDGVAAGANAYKHPSYTSRTGVPTANQTPAFGGSFTVTQPISDATGHITAMNSRTVTIPSTAASASAAGLVSTGAQTFAGNKTFNGQVIPAGASAVGTAQARKIYAGTSDMTAGTTALETGAIYLVYE